jgi:hypothetical protein
MYKVWFTPSTLLNWDFVSVYIVRYCTWYVSGWQDRISFFETSTKHTGTFARTIRTIPAWVKLSEARRPLVTMRLRAALEMPFVRRVAHSRQKIQKAWVEDRLRRKRDEGQSIRSHGAQIATQTTPLICAAQTTEIVLYATRRWSTQSLQVALKDAYNKYLSRDFVSKKCGR